MLSCTQLHGGQKGPPHTTLDTAGDGVGERGLPFSPTPSHTHCRCCATARGASQRSLTNWARLAEWRVGLTSLSLLFSLSPRRFRFHLPSPPTSPTSLCAGAAMPARSSGEAKQPTRHPVRMEKHMLTSHVFWARLCLCPLATPLHTRLSAAAPPFPSSRPLPASALCCKPLPPPSQNEAYRDYGAHRADAKAAFVSFSPEGAPRFAHYRMKQTAGDPNSIPPPFDEFFIDMDRPTKTSVAQQIFNVVRDLIRKYKLQHAPLQISSMQSTVATPTVLAASVSRASIPSLVPSYPLAYPLVAVSMSTPLVHSSVSFGPSPSDAPSLTGAAQRVEAEQGMEQRVETPSSGGVDAAAGETSTRLEDVPSSPQVRHGPYCVLWGVDWIEATPLPFKPHPLFSRTAGRLSLLHCDSLRRRLEHRRLSQDGHEAGGESVLP